MLFSPAFWHAQLNYACQRAEHLATGAGTVDNLAGDQLCMWNQVNLEENTIIPSMHVNHIRPSPMGRPYIGQHQKQSWPELAKRQLRAE